MVFVIDGRKARAAIHSAILVVGFVAVFVAAAALSGCAGGPKSEAKPDAISSVSLVGESRASVLGELGSIPTGGRTLVVFFTTGNAAERVATDLAEMYSADVERIVEKNPQAWSFMSGGFAASIGQAVDIQPPLNDPAAYDRVFVLTPVWAWSLSPPVRSWLRWAKGRLPEVAYGTISGDTEPDKIVAQMTKESGRTPFAYAGFSEKDFAPENRGTYIEKLQYLAGLKARGSK